MLSRAKSKNSKGLRRRISSFVGLYETDQVIEVFDVLIESKNRISCIDPETNKDILLSQSYKDKMKQRFHRVSVDSNTEPTEVRSSMREYVPACKYDLEDPEFRQMHCLRFEIDKSKMARSLSDPKTWEKNPLYKQLKITDVDFFLNGNKHAQLH